MPVTSEIKFESWHEVAHEYLTEERFPYIPPVNVASILRAVQRTIEYVLSRGGMDSCQNADLDEREIVLASLRADSVAKYKSPRIDVPIFGCAPL